VDSREGQARSALFERGVRNEVEDGVCLARPEGIKLSGSGRIFGLCILSTEQYPCNSAKNRQLSWTDMSTKVLKKNLDTS